MAGLYDTILRGDPYEAARQQAKARLEAAAAKQQSQFLAALQGTSRQVRQGAVTGMAAGNLAAILTGAAGERQDKAIAESPEVQQVKQSQDIIRQLQKIEAGRGTADWYTQAAGVAKESGNEGLAFQLLGSAAEARKAEAKLERDLKDKEASDWRATVNTLPSAQKYSLIVNDPEHATAMYGLSGKEADAFVKDAQDNLDTVRAKNVAELTKIKPVNPANVTKGDLSAVDTSLATMGYDADAFNPGFGKDEEGRGQFVSLLTDQARTEQELRARRTGETLPLDQIVTEIMGDLESNKVFVRNPDRFGSGFTLSDEFSADSVRNVFKSRINEYQGSKPEAARAAKPATEAAQSGAEAPFVDFTQPPR